MEPGLAGLVAVWAAGLWWWLTPRAELRESLRLVRTANVAAAAALVGAGLVVPSALLGLILAAAALEVAGFAVSQQVALARLWRA